MLLMEEERIIEEGRGEEWVKGNYNWKCGRIWLSQGSVWAVKLEEKEMGKRKEFVAEKISVVKFLQGEATISG